MEGVMATAKAYKGLPMEGIIATWYARNTGRDMRRFTDTARLVAERVRPGGDVLEVAPGPGYLAIELAKRGYVVTALDISRTFVRIARENAAKSGVTVDARHGNSSAMPFPDASFDFVVCMAAFKNFTDPVGAINEMHRVLRPGGQASIFDLRKDASLPDIAAEVRGMQLSAVNALVTRFIFRYGLLRAAYTREQLERMAAQSRFARCEIECSGIALEVRLTKVGGPGGVRSMNGTQQAL
jgi:ubiquinone/menaquinone biosynthesis C-methylase UbiE